MPRIEAKHASLRFGSGRTSRWVLRGIDFAPEAGVLTAVLGPNGAGKTTLLRMLLGALRPTSGTVRLDGVAVTDISERVRAGYVAYIPQRTSVAFPFRVRDVVAMGRYAAGHAQDKAVDKALDMVGLRDRAADLIGELSAGQQQRATLARVLAQVDGRAGMTILADEPVSAMDPAHALEAMRVLHELASRGMSVVTVLHDLNLAFRWAGRTLLLRGAGNEADAGASTIAANGPTHEVVTPATLASLYGVRFERVRTASGSDVIVGV